MKRKILVSLAACSAVVLAFSSIGATQAALTYLSDDYLAQIDLKSIGVTLTENGEDISWRDYRHRDDSWSEATGELLGKLLETAGDDKIVLDKHYPEELAVKNSGTIDEYVRVTVSRYWIDEKSGEKRADLDPSKIKISFTNDGWVEDKSAETSERNVFYYTSILKKGATSSLFADKISIDGDIASLVSKEEYVDDEGYKNIVTTYAYDGATFVIEACVDAVQTHNAKEAIKSAWGIDVNIGSNGSLSLN